jgi:hypothetical protein
MFEKLNQYKELGKVDKNKALEEYQVKVRETSVEVLKLIEGKVDTFGKALDVIKTCEATLSAMMYGSKFEEPKK